MNNDPIPSSSETSPTLQNGLPSATTADDSNGDATLKRLQLEKRVAFLDHLILNLDIMIYLQVSVLYYMDPSLLFLLFRLIPQWIYLTPKSPLLPPFPVTSRPYILLFFVFNFGFLVIHFVANPPAAGEATRGYLHGGMIIDFVGQMSPVNKFRLVATDVLVWVLQVVMLAVSLERRKLGGETSETAAAGANPALVGEEAHLRQDYDAEERGERRAANPGDNGDIEMQPLQRVQSGSDEPGGRGDHLFDSSAAASTDRHPLDTFNSGQYVIANLDLFNMVHTQWLQRNTFRTQSSGPADAQSDPSVAAVATILAGRSLGFRLRVGGQPLGTG